MAEWCFACPDWRERLKAGTSLVPALPLDRDLAGRAVRIFNKLRLPDVAGQPPLKDAAGDWFRDIVAALFGSLMPDGRRMVRQVFVLVPKKNSKTTGAGAIGVTALLMDPVPRQPYFIYGPTQAIAQRGFEQAEGMILADPVLKDRFLIKAHLKTILDQVTGSTLKVQTFDEKVATGVIPKGMIVDEVHILGKVHYASRVMGQLWGGLVSKPDGFMLKITTQSDQAPAGVFKEDLDLARAIRDGRVTGDAALAMLPVLYEFAEEFQTREDQPWRDPAHWPLVLPNLGRSVQLDLLKQDYAVAVEKGEVELQRWASQHLNIEIGLGLHDGRWIGADYWQGAVFEPLRDLDELLARSEVAVVGVDSGGLDDLTGLCVAGRDRKTKVWLLWFHAWAHRKVLDIRKAIASRLLDFERDGDLTFWGDARAPVRVAQRLGSDGASEDYLARGEAVTANEDFAAIVEICVRVRDAGLLPEQGGIGLDPAVVGALLDALEQADFALVNGGAGNVELVSQSTVNMFSAINALQRRLESGSAAHGGAPMMDWCVGNAKAVQKGNAVAITKDVAGRAKIDPLVAGFIAVKMMERNPVAKDSEPSYWEVMV